MLKADCIVRGDYLLPMDEEHGVIEDGALAVSGASIAAVGTYEDVAAGFQADRIIGGAGRAVIPGLVNAHTHAAMVYMRGLADDLPLKEWLTGHIWPVENRWLGPEFVNDALELAALEMLTGGVTCFSDMYFFEEQAARVAKRLGIRAVLGAGIMDVPTKTTTGADDCLRRAADFISRWKDDAWVRPAVAPHTAYTCSPETLERSLNLAEEHDVLIHTHLSETRWEVEEVRSRYGRTPVLHLESMGVLCERVLAAHCVWVSDEEIELLARRGVGVSHCAESNLKLASGIAPVAKMLTAGLHVALGTDGAASNNDLDIFGEMATAAKLHKGVTLDPTVLDARTVLLMATRWGAEALGLSHVGSLEEGKAADVVVVDLGSPHLAPLYDIHSHLVYAVRSSDVSDVLVGGRHVVSDGCLQSGDEEEILEKARRWGRRVWEAGVR